MWEPEVRGGHGSLPFFLLFSLHVVFVLKFLFERAKGSGRSHEITSSLGGTILATPLQDGGKQRRKQLPVT